MAEALISVLIEQLASITYEHIRGKVRLILDVENEVVEFTSNLKAIQAVLKDAEKRQVKESFFGNQVKESVVQDWLDKLKQVSFEMDDVLDEWNTELEKQDHEGENSLVKREKKVRFSIPCPFFCFGQVGQVLVRSDIAQKIKDLNSRLTLIAEERQKYQFQSTATSGFEQPERPKSTSLVDVSKIFGREDEKYTLVSMLLGKSSGKEKMGPLVIPVVGMGGMGKTALSQLAYNNEDVKAHFQMRKWICVSDHFDVIKIAKTIISDEKQTPISDELDDFMGSVSKSVERKRFLLVLDDLWTEDDTEWNLLMLALMSGAEGSRILVTTRNEAVARMMRATTQIIHLEKLRDQHCFSLFYHLAFLNREEKKSDLFEGIGQKIAKKCKGSPLAAKTLGSLMWNKTLKEWSDVLNSEIWDLEVVEKKVFQPLLLSYHDLTSEIKRCLLFCACFPQDHRFYKDTLIELWMSQNYLNSKGHKERRTIGQNYFDALVARSFFQDFELDDKGNIETCLMHDIVHEFLKFLAGNESLIIDLADGANRATELSSDKVCHLSARGRLSGPISFHKCTNLRTLATFDLNITTTDWDLVLQLKCLRTLNLSRSRVKEVPKEIGELLRLRYIDLSRNGYLNELPDTICNLFNLETLHLERCGLEKLPKAMGKLINLKHLYVRGCLIKYLPKGIGRISGLRKLDEYEVICGEHGDNGNEILELGDLGVFDQLQGKIAINKLGKVIDASEAQKAQFEKKKDLLDLELDFGNIGGRSKSDLGDREDVEEEERRRRKGDAEVLNALQPHKNLEYLKIVYYRGTKVSPKWLMSLHHLRFLTLDHCRECDCLPPLGRLPSLEVLKINDMNVKKVGIEFLGIEETQTSPVTAFPNLEKLSFRNTVGWKEWEGVQGCMEQVTIMPHLSHLEIHAPSLKKQLPDFLQNRPHLNLCWITDAQNTIQEKIQVALYVQEAALDFVEA